MTNRLIIFVSIVFCFALISPVLGETIIEPYEDITFEPVPDLEFYDGLSVKASCPDSCTTMRTFYMKFDMDQVTLDTIDLASLTITTNVYVFDANNSVTLQLWQVNDDSWTEASTTEPPSGRTTLLSTQTVAFEDGEDITEITFSGVGDFVESQMSANGGDGFASFAVVISESANLNPTLTFHSSESDGFNPYLAFQTPTSVDFSSISSAESHSMSLFMGLAAILALLTTVTLIVYRKNGRVTAAS